MWFSLPGRGLSGPKSVSVVVAHRLPHFKKRGVFAIKPADVSMLDMLGRGIMLYGTMAENETAAGKNSR